MTRAEVLEKTRRIVLDLYPEMADVDLTEDTVVNTDIGIDSMGFVLIICKLEALFGVKIPERQWNKLSTLGDVVDTIMKYLPQR